MSERHSVIFASTSFNVISDHENGTITLQFERAGGSTSPDRPFAWIVTRIQGHFGGGVVRRFVRHWTGRNSLLLPSAEGKPHPNHPDIYCYEIGVRPGERVEAALAALLDFLRRQPTYERTLGPPLDRDEAPERVARGPRREPSEAAGDVLRAGFQRWASARARSERPLPPKRRRWLGLRD